MDTITHEGIIRVPFVLSSMTPSIELFDGVESAEVVELDAGGAYAP